MVGPGWMEKLLLFARLSKRLLTGGELTEAIVSCVIINRRLAVTRVFVFMKL